MIAGLGWPVFFAYLVAGIEFFGGLCVLLGLFTRYAAALIGVVMLFAVALVKWKMGLLGGYELDAGFFALAFSLATSGAGKWSLEKAWFKKEH